MIEGNNIAKTVLKDIMGEMAKRKGKKMLIVIKGRPADEPEDMSDKTMDEVPEVDGEDERIRALIEKILDERGEA